MLKKISTIILVIFSVNAACSQAPAIEWQKCYGGINTQAAMSVQQTTDGGYITCGTTSIGNPSDYWILKLDATGNIQWQKTYGGGGDDQPLAGVRQTPDGGYIVAGFSNSNNSGDVGAGHGDFDYWVLKLNSTGDIVWKKNLGGSGADFARSITLTTDGGSIIAGESHSNDGDVTGNHGMSDSWLVKLDASGNIQWQRSYGGSAGDEADCIKQTTDGGYIVSGASDSPDGDVSNPLAAVGLAWILKLDASGNIQWQKSYGSTIGGEYSWSICQTGDGGYAFTGICNGNGGNVTGNHGLLDYWVVKLDAAGSLVWQKSLGGSGIEQPNTIIESFDGNLVVSGWSGSTDGDVTGAHGGYDYWVVKLSATGSLIWQKAMGGNAGEQNYDLIQTSDMGYIIAGHSNSNNSGDVGSNTGAPTNDFWIVKLASELVPVTLVGFNAAAKGNNVLCSWQTEQEQNSSHFIIERSNDGLYFDSTGRVAAAGNSATVLGYNFTDHNAGLSNKEFLYYRLKMVDIDGSFKYSGIARVKLVQSAMSIYPNPVVNDLNISFTSSASEQATLLLFNEVGAKVHEQTISIIPGNNSIILAMNSYPPGVYTVLLTGQNHYQARFIVLRPNRF